METGTSIEVHAQRVTGSVETGSTNTASVSIDIGYYLWWHDRRVNCRRIDTPGVPSFAALCTLAGLASRPGATRIGGRADVELRVRVERVERDGIQAGGVAAALSSLRQEPVVEQLGECLAQCVATF